MKDLSLPDLARLQADLSASSCAPACRDYHAVWPLLRTAGLVGGVDADRGPLLELLAPLLTAGGGKSVLVAGCADSALLSLVSAIAPATSRITIVDRCATPLAVCRQVAPPALTLTTRQSGLLDYAPPEPFDVIVCHSLLPFFSDEDRQKLLRRFARWLAPGGRLVLAVRLKSREEAHPQNDRAQIDQWVATRAAEARAALAATPQTAELLSPCLAGHLEGYYRVMSMQNLACSSEEEVINELNQAGLSVNEVLPGGKGLSFMTPDWRSQREVSGRVFLASGVPVRAGRPGVARIKAWLA